MRIYTRGGDIPFERFTFPDGQRHLQLLADPDEWASATIEMALTCADDLFDLLLVVDVVDNLRIDRLDLDIRYMLGARMDRRIDDRHPWTLPLVAAQVAGCGFDRIRVLDPHSDATLEELEASPVYPYAAANQALMTLSDDGVVVCPDHGARARVERLAGGKFPIAYCRKRRRSDTGALSAFELEDWDAVRGRDCLILDDICDGGGTFTGLAEVLAKAGAGRIDLFVTHGIFSKGLPLRGINQVYCTDSRPFSTAALFAQWPIVIPVSMKDMP